MTIAAVTLSHGETEALATKAARGAGMDWGLAEEAGRAARRLSERGRDGLFALLGHLEEVDDWAGWRPRIEARRWTAPSGTLCPIALGATLCDHADLSQGPLLGGPIETGPVNRPLLLAPFLMRMSGGGVAIVARWPTPDGPREATLASDHPPGPWATLARCELVVAARRRERPERMERPAAAAPCAVSAATIAGLDAFAMRTTVPASQASRAGAGAGRDDD